MRAIIRHFISFVLMLAIATPAVFVAPTPAKAGIDACIALATDFGLEDVQKVASFVADHGQCVGDLSNPSFLAVVAAVLLIEQSTGAFSNFNSCEAALGGVAGKPIAAAIASLGTALGLPQSAIDQLQSFASDQGAQGLVQFMNSTPGLNVISGNWSCACAVRYSGVAEKIEQIINNLLSCTGGVLESGLDALGNFYEDTFGGTTPGTMYVEEYVYPCKSGWVTGFYDSYSQSFVPSGCACPPPSHFEKGSSGKNGACKCPSGQGYKNEQCSPCNAPNSYVAMNGVCTKCAFGQKPGKNLLGVMTCLPACDSGEVMNGNGACQACSAGTYASTPSDSSAGTCKTCPAGTTSTPGTTSCSSVCKYWEEWDAKSKACKSLCPAGQQFYTPKDVGYSCRTCPSGQKYDASSNSCGCDPWQKIDPSSQTCQRICPPGQKWTDMHTAPGTYSSLTCQSCPKGSEYAAATNSCVACPTSMNWTKAADGSGACVCPEGSNRQGWICVPNDLNPTKTATPGSVQGIQDIPDQKSKSCPMGWSWSALTGKCKPGLKDVQPQTRQKPTQGSQRGQITVQPSPPNSSQPGGTPAPSAAPIPGRTQAAPTSPDHYKP